jgi:hypothetical protein
MCSNPVANARNTTAIRLRRICHGCSIPLLSHGKSYLLGWRASSDISGAGASRPRRASFCCGFEGAPAACLLPGLSLASALLRAPVAQLDRASDYGSEGLGFESLRARHSLAPSRRSGAVMRQDRVASIQATRRASARLFSRSPAKARSASVNGPASRSPPPRREHLLRRCRMRGPASARFRTPGSLPIPQAIDRYPAASWRRLVMRTFDSKLALKGPRKDPNLTVRG